MPSSHDPDVLFVYRELPDPLRPCFRYHDEERNGTVLFLDPRATAVEWVAWGIDNLTIPERNVIRSAYGEQPVPARLSDRCVQGLVRPPASLLVQDRRKPRVDEIKARFHKKMQDKTWHDITRRLAM